MTVNIIYNYERLVDDSVIGKLNNGTTGISNIDVVLSADGNALVTYDEDGQLVLQTIAPDGTVAAAQTQINTTQIGLQQGARSVVLSDGKTAYVFQDFDVPGEEDIRAQILNSNGLPTQHLGNGTIGTSDFRVSDNDTDRQGDGAIVALDGGGFVVTYLEEQTSGDNAIRARQFDNTGTPVGGFILVTAMDGVARSEPEVLELSDGRLLFAWVEDDTTDTSVFGRFYDPTTGAFDGNAFSITSNDGSDHVALARASTGGFIAAVSSLDAGGAPAQLLEFDSTAAQINSIGLDNGDTTLSAAQILTLSDDVWAVYYNDVFTVADLDPRIEIIDGIGSGLFSGNRVAMTLENEFEGNAAIVDYGNGLVGSFFENEPTLGAPLEVNAQIGQYSRILTGDGDADLLTGWNNRDSLNGGDGDDTLIGNGGDDDLIGGAGADTMTGGRGNDAYSVDNAGDQVIESNTVDGGNDTVVTTVSYNVPVNVEVLIMLGTANIASTGTSQRDIIVGNSGDNVINGAGGIDVMRGGAGNDTYAVDDSSDAVIEAAGEGDDAVYSSVDYILDGAQEIETAILTGSAVVLRGDDSDNQLFGNDQVNVLEGKLGTDYLLGLGGDDIFQVSKEANATDLDVFGDFEGAGVVGGDRIAFAASEWGLDGVVTQISQTSFEVTRADGSNAQQFIIANLAVGNSGLLAGDDYFFG